MTLAELQQAVLYLFPKVVYGQNYTAGVDSTGAATIDLWQNALGAQPDTTALTAALAAAQLAAAKTAQEQTLTTAYDSARYASTVALTSGSTTLTFPTDQATQLNIMGYVATFAKMATPPASVILADASGTVQSLTPSQVQTLAEDIMTQSQTDYSQLKTLLAQVDAATTVADVQAIVW